jgi:hypothetical protein
MSLLNFWQKVIDELTLMEKNILYEVENLKKLALLLHKPDYMGLALGQLMTAYCTPSVTKSACLEQTL